MADEPKVITQCATCHRAIFTIHVDAAGDCGECQRKYAVANPKPDTRPKRRRTGKS